MEREEEGERERRERERERFLLSSFVVQCTNEQELPPLFQEVI